MIKTTSIITTCLSVLVVAGAMAALDPLPAAAQTATKLNCKNCVKSRQIKNNGIKSKDIKDGQVTNSDLAGGAVDGAKVADDSLTASDLGDEAGVDWAAEDDGTTIDDDEVVRSQTITAPTGGFIIATATGTLVNGSIDLRVANCSLTTGAALTDITTRVPVEAFFNRPVAATMGFSVPAGSTTISFVCATEGAGTLGVNDAALTLIFTSTQY